MKEDISETKMKSISRQEEEMGGVGDSEGYSFRKVREDELERVFELEKIGFPADEAASLESIKFRHSVAPELFIGAYESSKSPGGLELIGFINCTRSVKESLDHDSLMSHDDYGNVILLHSISVDPSHRRKGIGTRLLKHFVKLCEESGEGSILLACHEELKKFYGDVGFVENEDEKRKEFVHGSRRWFEMRIKFEDDGRRLNPSKILCPIERCRCVILRKGVGRLISRMKCPLPESKLSKNNNEKPYTSCWIVPSPTSFDNIGFSKPVVQNSNGTDPTDNLNSNTNKPSSVQMRWLSCGSCDFGPIGWTESNDDLALQFSRNPSGSFKNVLFLIDFNRVYYSD